jgi:hypothetical protein
MRRALILSTLAVAAIAAACAEPTRTLDRVPTRTLSRVIDGRTYRLTIDGATALMTIDGRPSMRVRRDGALRRVTVWQSDGRTVERSYRQEGLREAAAAFARSLPPGTIPTPYPEPRFPTPPGAPAPSDSLPPVTAQDACSSAYIVYAAACAVAIAACSAGPNPACIAAIGAAAVALDGVMTQCNAT